MNKFDLKKWLIEEKQWKPICFIGGMFVLFVCAIFFIGPDEQISSNQEGDTIQEQQTESLTGEENADSESSVGEGTTDFVNPDGTVSDSQNNEGHGQGTLGGNDTESKGASGSENDVNEHDNQSSTVEVEPQKDPLSEDVYIAFPCTIAGYELEIEKVEAYAGYYVEDGTTHEVSDIAALYVTNKGNKPIEYAEIFVGYEGEILTFHISALPVGARMVVQEKNEKKIPEGLVKTCTATVIQKDQLEMSKDKVSVEDNGDDTITIKNLTDKTIPAIRIFYKYYNETDEFFLGGIAFTAKVTQLGAKEEIRIQPSHYFSEGSVIIRVSTYETDL